MDITSIPQSRYTARAFQNVQYDQPQATGYQGGAAGPSVVGDASFGAGPMPGSNRMLDSAVWVEQPREKAFLMKVHVSEAGSGMLARLEGKWEMQSWIVRRMYAEQNSLERQAEAGATRLRNALGSMMALTGRVDTAGHGVDIYA